MKVKHYILLVQDSFDNEIVSVGQDDYEDIEPFGSIRSIHNNQTISCGDLELKEPRFRTKMEYHGCLVTYYWFEFDTDTNQTKIIDIRR